MAVFWELIELIATIFEFSIVIKLLNGTVKCKFPQNKGRIIGITFILILTIYMSVINELYVFEGWLSLITVAITIVYSFIALKGSIWIKTIMPIIAYSLILIINSLVTYVLSAIFGMSNTFIFTENDSVRLLALFLTKFLFYICSELMIIILKKEPIDLKSKELLISVAMSVLTFAVAMTLVKIQLNSQNNDILIFICILCVLIMDVFIIYMMVKFIKDNKDKLRLSILELQLSEQRAMLEDAGSINKEIRKAEHDLKHHILSVLGTVENGDLEKAKKYLNDLLHEYETNIFKYIFIDNSAINSILNMKISRCRAENIDIKVEICSNFDGFNDIDICVLLANLFDNAIEASCKVTFPKIMLVVHNEKNYLRILVKNHVDISVLAENKMLRTTKPDNKKHGLGIYSISQIVEKYNGMKSYYEKDGYFFADIWLKKDTFELSKQLENEVNYQIRHN